MIAIDRLTFGYRESEFRLAIPALRVDRGGRLAVIGPSGAGKTTLLNLIAGILTPGKGKVEVAGTEVSALSDARRRDFRIRNRRCSADEGCQSLHGLQRKTVSRPVGRIPLPTA
jgi:ABC-type lipoprotein export system ATPase subunit